MEFKTIEKFDFEEKKVLLRLDLNSPVLKGKVIDSPRIIQGALVIRELMELGAKVIVIAHQGRKGDPDFVPLKQHSKLLSRHAKKKIRYVNDLFGGKAAKEIENIKTGESLLLKNVRSENDEFNLDSKNNRYPKFCEMFDIYINDAFSVCHRKQGSIIIPPRYLPSGIGREFEREIIALKKFSFSGKERKVFLIGGVKVEDYMCLFKVLENKNNKILASGVLGNLILISIGYNLGYEKKWAKERGLIKLLPELKRIYSTHKSQILLPLDFAIGSKKRKEVMLEDCPFKEKLLDIGHETINLFKKEINKSSKVFIKGPLGFSEIKEFSYGTVEILKFISELTKKGKIFSLLGGGHLTTTIEKYKIKNNFSYISLSGGALIKYIAGEKLPGVEALKK